MSKEKLDQFLESVENYDDMEDGKEDDEMGEDIDIIDGKIHVYALRKKGTDEFIGTSKYPKFGKKSIRIWNDPRQAAHALKSAFYNERDIKKNGELVEFSLDEEGTIQMDQIDEFLKQKPLKKK